MTRKFAAPALGALLALTAVSAQAQQAAAPTAAAAPAPVIPNVCVFSQERAIQGSIVGKYITQRLQQIDNQSSAELNGERTKIETDAKAFEAARATMTQDQMQQQGGAIQARAQQFDQLVQIRVREMELTQQKALQTIGQSLDPLVMDTFKARNCALLLDNNSVFMFSSAMDVTADVTTKLDGKLKEFPLERESLPAQGAGGAPAPAAAPRATTPAARPATPAPARRR